MLRLAYALHLLVKAHDRCPDLRVRDVGYDLNPVRCRRSNNLLERRLVLPGQTLCQAERQLFDSPLLQIAQSGVVHAKSLGYRLRGRASVVEVLLPARLVEELLHPSSGTHIPTLRRIPAVTQALIPAFLGFLVLGLANSRISPYAVPMSRQEDRISAFAGLGEAVKRLRKAARLRQDEVAARAGVSLNTISKLESFGGKGEGKGQYSPTIATLAAVLDALDCSAFDLVKIVHDIQGRPVFMEPGEGLDAHEQRRRIARNVDRLDDDLLLLREELNLDRR